MMAVTFSGADGASLWYCNWPGIFGKGSGVKGAEVVGSGESFSIFLMMLSIGISKKCQKDWKARKKVLENEKEHNIEH